MIRFYTISAYWLYSWMKIISGIIGIVSLSFCKTYFDVDFNKWANEKITEKKFLEMTKTLYVYGMSKKKGMNKYEIE